MAGSNPASCGIDKINQLVAPSAATDVQQPGGRGAAGLGGTLASEPVCDEVLGAEQCGGPLEMMRLMPSVCG